VNHGNARHSEAAQRALLEWVQVGNANSHGAQSRIDRRSVAGRAPSREGAVQ
jgi:hypothetical protein